MRLQGKSKKGITVLGIPTWLGQEMFGTQLGPDAMRAAGLLSNSTLGEPAAMGLVPWPGTGQAVGSPWRAAGLPDIHALL